LRGLVNSWSICAFGASQRFEKKMSFGTGRLEGLEDVASEGISLS